jgi:hypothetical protein
MAHEPRKRRILTQLGHSPTDPEARLHHQKQLRCVDPLGSMPTAERSKAGRQSGDTGCRESVTPASLGRAHGRAMTMYDVRLSEALFPA